METGWSDLAESNNFIVVYPEAGGWWNAYDWGGAIMTPGFGGGPRTSPRDDAGFLLALIKKLESEYAIDGNRVYMTGLSIGASETITCAFRFGDELAAIAPVSSAWMTNDPMFNIDPYSVPQPKGPIPVYLWRGSKEVWPSLDEERSQMQYWMNLDHVENTSRVITEGGYTTEIYTGGYAEVWHTEIAGRGHESYDRNTARMIWYDFFVRFSREAIPVEEQP
jgi:poly(3-hydroxybutyrate) depolymerase